MNTLIHLTAKDFSVQKNAKDEQILCNNIKGISLVVFYTGGKTCKYCDELMPQFKKLPEIISSIKFAAINIDVSMYQNRELLSLSKTTITPITHVPDIILCVDGQPYIQYDDKFTLEKLIEFVQYTVKMVNAKKSFAPQYEPKKVENEIPPYSIGIPYECDKDGVCYFTYSEAYGKENKLG